MQGRKILLIVGGGIAAYKACELIRLIRKAGGSVRCVLTAGGAQFITPMTLAALSEQQVFTNLFDLKDEAEMGHIQLSREADLVVVAPATADLLAKMAAGIADDLATTFASRLLGEGFGTGEYELYGAFVIDLETGDMVDDPDAQKPLNMM